MRMSNAQSFLVDIILIHYVIGLALLIAGASLSNWTGIVVGAAFLVLAGLGSIGYAISRKAAK